MEKYKFLLILHELYISKKEILFLLNILRCNPNHLHSFAEIILLDNHHGQNDMPIRHVHINFAVG